VADSNKKWTETGNFVEKQLQSWKNGGKTAKFPQKPLK